MCNPVVCPGSRRPLPRNDIRGSGASKARELVVNAWLACHVEPPPVSFSSLIDRCGQGIEGGAVQSRRSPNSGCISAWSSGKSPDRSNSLAQIELAILSQKRRDRVCRLYRRSSSVVTSNHGSVVTEAEAESRRSWTLFRELSGPSAGKGSVPLSTVTASLGALIVALIVHRADQCHPGYAGAKQSAVEERPIR